MAVLIPGKLLYLRSPHTASVATERAIVQANAEAIVIVPGHCTMEEILHGSAESRDGGVEANGLREGNELIVTTVRSPYDVIVTWWIRNGEKGSFAKFIREYDRKPHVIDGKIFSQVKHCNVVMRYENLYQDIKDLMRSMGLPTVEIPVDNETPGKAPWGAYYDAEALDAAYERFGAEIDELGYSLTRAQERSLAAYPPPSPGTSTDA